MRVKLLSDDGQISAFIEACGDQIVDSKAEYLVSFGHRSVLTAEELAPFGDRAINLHIGALPWNRGAHPNFWAWKENTPHGVTLHRMTERLDDGPIIAQRRLSFGPGFTFHTSWLRLVTEARAMFMEYWPELRIGKRGTYHSTSDLPTDTNWEAPCE